MVSYREWSAGDTPWLIEKKKKKKRKRKANEEGDEEAPSAEIAGEKAMQLVGTGGFLFWPGVNIAYEDCIHSWLVPVVLMFEMTFTAYCIGCC